ncbi:MULTISPECIES: cupin domain-containing protein [Streptococcus]|uniref:Cupin domain-containing protein n=5 Tax=Streptococcus dysgalactiae TaxID=1334 RepID=D2KVE1_STREQ|nr:MULTISPECIES: cupin domain-containing protein [Streptococcus]ADX25409.1 ethanolamine utilization EutQ family protein [Streptococcus dysgalactiae subsp. equisimilis ATCC 12394]EGL49071.1 ethanolamine utilization protein EutQ [Streptococcus dysgalactiae subsp. equisimilis SK1249]BAN94450.1 ethanolamine utilization EutQ family protein [Streptococcus dysgalactiae subsp. equisimilis 167]KKC20398.1 ethanolamine utilization protein EutQ [Streptococcus dysgalactiae subsp. equisimilis]KKC22711.1 eth
MATLIIAKDIAACHEAGQSICYIEKGTLITPAARDEAKKWGISFETCPPKEESSHHQSLDNISSDDLLALLKKMLMGTKETCQREDLPYRCVSHSNGLKMVRGSSVRMDDFDTGTPEAVVGFQELVGKDESKMSAGFLTIDQSSFAWDLPYEEIDYVISGTVSISIDGQTYVAREGDVIYVPSGSHVILGSPDKAKLFYTTYPSNWLDLT